MLVLLYTLFYISRINQEEKNHYENRERNKKNNKKNNKERNVKYYSSFEPIKLNVMPSCKYMYHVC